MLAHWGRDRARGTIPLPHLIEGLTQRPARMLGLDDRGRIAPGLSADMIAVAGDPLSDVAVLEKVDWVMVRGRAAD